MSTLKHTPWHPLPLTATIRGAPPLLLQSTFTSSTYTIYLTDLTHIWSTTATKPNILALSETLQTSIDPSETSQLTILLTKLESALSAPSDNTDVTLTSTSSGSLHIHTSTELPLPLKELKWVFQLTRLPDTEFTGLFLLPVLSIVSTLADQVESLLRVVRDKDRIIERLTDQVADQGLDVKALLGGGRVRRRGLEKFDVDAWREEYSQEGEKRVGEVVKEVFGEGVRCEEAPGVRGLGEVDGWWKSVEREEEEEEEEVKVERRVDSGERTDDRVASLTREVSPRRIISPKREGNEEGKSPVKKAKKEVDTDDDDDDCEVQKTPPLKPFHPFTLKPPSPPPAPPADDTASDSDDLDLPPPRKFTPAPKSIGKIGGPSRQQKSPSPPPLARNLDTRDEDTEDSDTVVVTHVGKEKGPVKMISGKKAVDVDGMSEDEGEVKVKKIGKIGKIGGRKVKDDIAVRVKSPTPPPPPPPPQRTPTPEDEDEKADRKRRELEKELEAKKKAPAKKKRKF